MTTALRKNKPLMIFSALTLVFFSLFLTAQAGIFPRYQIDPSTFGVWVYEYEGGSYATVLISIYQGNQLIAQETTNAIWVHGGSDVTFTVRVRTHFNYATGNYDYDMQKTSLGGRILYWYLGSSPSTEPPTETTEPPTEPPPTEPPTEPPTPNEANPLAGIFLLGTVISGATTTVIYTKTKKK